VTGEDNRGERLSDRVAREKPAKLTLFPEPFTSVDLWWTPEPFINAPVHTENPCKSVKPTPGLEPGTHSLRVMGSCRVVPSPVTPGRSVRPNPLTGGDSR
jgi:hypothetical protein